MSDVVFRMVLPVDVSREWDAILPGLRVVAAHADHWRVEDVYVALRQATADLLIASRGGEYVGFVVINRSDHYDGPVLHVWAAYSAAHDVDVLACGRDEIDGIARRIGARRCVFISPRRGWRRAAARLGYHPTMTVYEREVTP